MSVQQKQNNQTTSTIESLEGRQLFSAAAPALDAGLAADTASAGGTGKVSMQDFHFVMKLNKASPKLLASQDEAAGASFVKKMDKPSPELRVVLNDVLIASRGATGDDVADDTTLAVAGVSKASPKLFL